MTRNDIHAFAVLAYGSSPYLEECILSLKNQTVQSHIYITTSTPSPFLEDISRKYSIPLLINKGTGGIASDWSFAYNQCKTKYLTLAHQDDVYLPEYTQSCLKTAEEDASAQDLIIFTKYSELIGKGERSFEIHLFIKDILLFPFILKKRIMSFLLKHLILSFGNPISCPTVMYHKAVIGDFKFSEDFQCNMDWDAWLRLSCKKGSFVWIRAKLVKHRIHNDAQTSRQIRGNIRQKEDRLIFEYLWPKPIALVLSSLYSLSTRFNE